MGDQRTNRAGGAAVTRFRFGLRSALLLLTVFAIVTACSCELLRACLRAERRARVEAQLQMSRGLHKSLVGNLREQMAADPVNARVYQLRIEDADADLAEVERLIAEQKK